ncbi:hypothetical protein [Peptostreptococcus porci]|uniref:hypothetical protein n=1 Tax=Peptostreptococcus porci TaxID=2652282 RepID=UPI002A835008|nr:hypothetical protein [Peptostreptococcus porci]MDY4127635.1 hypothetical protein [Peptostreptococcus porci]
MNKFIYVFTEEDKRDLLLNGYKYIGEINMGKKAFAFTYDEKLCFNETDKSKYLITNKMYF